MEHSEALLSAFELLQVLHDKGVLSLLRGAVAARDELVGMITATLDAPSSVQAIRNFLLLRQFVGAIPPEVLSSLVEAVRAGGAKEKPPRAPGLLRLVWRLRREESRHAAAAVLDLLEGFGRNL